MKSKVISRVTAEILEMADDMHRIGVMDEKTHHLITVRHLGRELLPSAAPISGEEIRALREREHLSQAVFARYLNLTVGYVSQLERGTKQPKGPALALLNVIRAQRASRRFFKVSSSSRMNLAPLITGFLVGGSLIVAIGPQNAFVLRMGLLRRHVFAIALFCAASDAVLILAGVAGLGSLLAAHVRIAEGISLAGALFLLWYGYKAFRRAFHAGALTARNEPAHSLGKSLAISAAFTWGNPHVYLDTVILVGSLSLPFAGSARVVYAAGAMLASFVWFFALAYGARILTPLFRREITWRVLDLFIAAVMATIALRLIYGVLA